MSCTTGDRSCETPRRRGAILVLALMAVIFLTLSVFSFIGARNQVTPDQISYKGAMADEGKHVFQSYNCMGCHTIVGNGAYLGPDLTKVYNEAGPAWLEAFIPSAGSWPTAAAVRVHLSTPEQLAAAGVGSWDEYLAKYPGAAERLERRGGHKSNMPNLQFRDGEVTQLIAFFKYTGAMNNEGWPPKIKVGDLNRRLELAGKAPAVAVNAVATDAQAATAAKPVDLAGKGAQVAKDLGCLACHATDTSRMVGPGWGGLYGHDVKLTDGKTVKADATYIKESILNPGAQIVEGYANLMPPYAGQVSDEDVDALVAYMASLNPAEKQ